MSGWLRGIYNAAANFNMRNALLAANGRSMGRNDKQLCSVIDEPNECCKSDQSSQSSESYNGHACPSHCARTCNCIGGECADNDGNDNDNADTDNDNGNEVRAKAGNENRNKVGNENRISCTCQACRELAEYAASPVAINPEGQGIGGGFRVGSELRNLKQPNPVSADSIEYITGIHTGDAV